MYAYTSSSMRRLHHLRLGSLALGTFVAGIFPGVKSQSRLAGSDHITSEAFERVERGRDKDEVSIPPRIKISCRGHLVHPIVLTAGALVQMAIASSEADSKRDAVLTESTLYTDLSRLSRLGLEQWHRSEPVLALLLQSMVHRPFWMERPFESWETWSDIEREKPRVVHVRQYPCVTT